MTYLVSLLVAIGWFTVAMVAMFLLLLSLPFYAALHMLRWLAKDRT